MANHAEAKRRKGSAAAVFTMAANALREKSESDADSGLETSESASVASPITKRKMNVSNEHEAEWSGKKSNILVCVRVRPMNKAERATSQDIIRVMDSKMVVIMDPKKMHLRNRVRGMLDPLRAKRTREKRYAFDHVFNRKASQGEVFEKTTRFLTNGVLNGFNATVFAYGATGAGKTFTMLGTHKHPGCMLQTLMHMYSRIDYYGRASRVRYTVKISMIEIYNEHIKDLLQPTGETLDLREDPIKGPTVAGILEVVADSAEHVMRLLERGNSKRTQEATKANKTSSRSHAVLQVVCEQRDINTGVSSAVKIGKLSMIDLAGSERASATQNRGQRLLEGANINRSLLALGNCINALVMGGKGAFVPYRDSKLTRLLKDSLGGNCRTVMIANISPAGKHFEETLNTLKYADRAKHIKTKVTRNVLNVNYHVSQYLALIGNLKKEISELKTELSLERRHSYPPGISSLSSTANMRELHAVKKNGTRLANLFRERMQARKSLIDLEAMIVQNRMEVRKSQLIIASAEMPDPDDRPTSAALEKARTSLQRQQAVLRKNMRSQKELQQRVTELETHAKNLRKEMMENITSEERQELLTLEVRMQTLELEKMDLEHSRMMHKSELDTKDTLIKRLRMQLAARDNIISQQREALESLGHSDRCLTAYKRLERLDTTSDGGTTPTMKLGAVAAVDAKRGDVLNIDTTSSPKSHTRSPRKKKSYDPTLPDVDDSGSPASHHSTSSSKQRKQRKTLAVAGGSILTGLDGRKIKTHANHQHGRHSRYNSKASKNRHGGIYVKGHDGIVNREMDDLNTEGVMSPMRLKPPRSPVLTPCARDSASEMEEESLSLDRTVRNERHHQSPHQWADRVKNYSEDSFESDNDENDEYISQSGMKSQIGVASDNGHYRNKSPTKYSEINRDSDDAISGLRHHLKPKAHSHEAMSSARSEKHQHKRLYVGGTSYSKANSDLERQIQEQLREIDHEIARHGHQDLGVAETSIAARPLPKRRQTDRVRGGRHRRAAAKGKRSNARFQRQQQLRKAQAYALGVRGRSRYNRK